MGSATRGKATDDRNQASRILISKVALITGVTGQDGAYLAELLLKKGAISFTASSGAPRCSIPTNLYGPGDNYHPQNSHVLPSLIRRFPMRPVCGFRVGDW